MMLASKQTLRFGESTSRTICKHVAVVFDDRLVVLERQRNAVIGRILGRFHHPFAAPLPDFLAGKRLVRHLPKPARDVVAAELRVSRHAGPGQEHAERLRAQVGRHPQQFSHIGYLALAVLGNGTAEIVVSGHGIEFDPFPVGELSQFPAAAR